MYGSMWRTSRTALSSEQVNYNTHDAYKEGWMLLLLVGKFLKHKQKDYP